MIGRPEKSTAAPRICARTPHFRREGVRFPPSSAKLMSFLWTAVEMFAEKKLVIFDLDGTLIDSLDMWDRVYVEIVRRTSVTAPDPAEM